jgi:hypothetical protein
MIRSEMKGIVLPILLLDVQCPVFQQSDNLCFRGKISGGIISTRYVISFDIFVISYVIRSASNYFPSPTFLSYPSVRGTTREWWQRPRVTFELIIFTDSRCQNNSSEIGT